MMQKLPPVRRWKHRLSNRRSERIGVVQAVNLPSRAVHWRESLRTALSLSSLMRPRQTSHGLSYPVPVVDRCIAVSVQWSRRMTRSARAPGSNERSERGACLRAHRRIAADGDVTDPHLPAEAASELGHEAWSSNGAGSGKTAFSRRPSIVDNSTGAIRRRAAMTSSTMDSGAEAPAVRRPPRYPFRPHLGAVGDQIAGRADLAQAQRVGAVRRPDHQHQVGP